MGVDGNIRLAVLEEAAKGTVDAYLDKGVLGATVVLLIIALIFAGLTIKHLYKDGRARDEQNVQLLERVLTLTEGAKSTAAANAAVLDGLKGVLETTRYAMDELNHEVEKNAREGQHSFANLATSIGSIAEILKAIRDQLAAGPRGRS